MIQFILRMQINGSQPIFSGKKKTWVLRLTNWKRVRGISNNVCCLACVPLGKEVALLFLKFLRSDENKAGGKAIRRGARVDDECVFAANRAHSLARGMMMIRILYGAPTWRRTAGWKILGKPVHDAKLPKGTKNTLHRLGDGIWLL
jgi:hypothetical protein